jgi:hypothetical protein
MLNPNPFAHSDILVLVSLRALSEYRTLHHTDQSPALVGHCFLSRREYNEDHLDHLIEPTFTCNDSLEQFCTFGAHAAYGALGETDVPGTPAHLPLPTEVATMDWRRGMDLTYEREGHRDTVRGSETPYEFHAPFLLDETDSLGPLGNPPAPLRGLDHHDTHLTGGDLVFQSERGTAASVIP